MYLFKTDEFLNRDSSNLNRDSNEYWSVIRYDKYNNNNSNL